jgi:hypothetical protein
MPVGSYASTGNLADDVQHIIAKGARLLRRHSIGIVVHRYS